MPVSSITCTRPPRRDATACTSRWSHATTSARADSDVELRGGQCAHHQPLDPRLWRELLARLIDEGRRVGLIPRDGDRSSLAALAAGRYIEAMDRVLGVLGELTFQARRPTRARHDDEADSTRDRSARGSARIQRLVFVAIEPTRAVGPARSRS
jgi:hypothetical protein